MTAVPSAPASTDERLNILLVDDRPDGLLSLEAALSRLGQNLVKAGSGRDALRLMLSMDFAVILLDVSMPDIDGFETAELIRARPRSKNTPIIFITAAVKNEASIFQGYAAGAVDFMIKPVVPDILRLKVAVFVEFSRKNAELLRLNDNLERQAAELAAANKELEAFSYSVSHDLRAPLRGIDGFSAIIARLYADKLDARGKELLERLQGSAERMGRLIDDLLKLSRMSRKEMKFETVDLSELARGVMERVTRAEPGRQAELRIAEGLTTVGDAGLIAILFENLISNAWKFSSKRADTLVEFGSETRSGGKVFFVRDNGVGFDMSLASKLFTPFQRLHAMSEFPGTGIVLATAHRIVARHGGRIWAEASPGLGATIFFTLPEPVHE